MKTAVSGALVALSVAVLAADWVIASRRAPSDTKTVAELQRQTRTDAQFAPRLAAAEKRITTARLSRKKRDNYAAWLLVAAASVFLYSWSRQVSPPPARRPDPRKSTRRRSTPPGPKPSPAAHQDFAFVDEAVARLGRTSESTIPLLQAIQAHYRYLPDEALRRVCELTEITPAEIAGTSSFYAHFRRSPVGEHVIRVCHGTACHVAGARSITDELRRHLAIPPGADTDPARRFTIDEVACLGCCSLAPVVMVDGQPAGKVTPATACDTLQEYA